MFQAVRALEPRHFGQFRCIGPECEDTCCDGWNIAIDRHTYEKYRGCSDPQFRPSFDRLIALNPEVSNDFNYAGIALTGTRCPFLTSGLCSIHQQLGEDYLSVMCATFPRILNEVDSVVERSLDLSCPEAARMALLNPDPMEFREEELKSPATRGPGLETGGRLDTLASQNTAKPFQHFREIRALSISLLQWRAYPLWKRLMMLGFFCQKVDHLAANAHHDDIPGIVAGYRQALETGVLDSLIGGLGPDPEAQLEIVLELIVARIGSDFTNRRFLECYKQFMAGIEWTPAAGMRDIAATYSAAYAQYFEPFMQGRQHILEHYLVSYVFESLFPLGPCASQSKLKVQAANRSIYAHFQLMALDYAAVKTLLIGLAARHKDEFGAGHIVTLISSYCRTFRHSLTYPDYALRRLSEKGLDNMRGMAVLVRN